MARIRSVHPGQWKDGDFLECCPLARLLALALRNMADDRGAFRWKPKTIKAECLPGDNCDIDELLEQLIESDQIERYEFEGKQFGIIRDFTQWQKPKKPTATYPIPEEVRKRLGLVTLEIDNGSEPVPNQFRTSTEKVQQTGGQEEVKKEEAKASSKENPPPEVPRETKPVTSPRGSRLPKDWHPPPEYLAEAERIGLTAQQALEEAEKFHDHFIAKPGKDGVKLDWLAAYRNWCRNALRWLPSNAGGSSGGGRAGVTDTVGIRDRLQREMSMADELSERRLARTGSG